MTQSGDPIALAKRVMRAEAALDVQRVMTRVYMEAWRTLAESLQPGTPRAALAVEMQARVNREIAAAQAEAEVSDDEIW